MTRIRDMGAGPHTAPHRWGRLVVGLYAWTTAVYFGFVWLDMTYSRLVVDPGSAFRTVADVLLALGGVIVLVGMAAIALAVRSRTDVRFLMASVIVVLLMFPARALLSGVLRGAASTLGPPLRILLTAGASGLAFLGFGRCER